MFSRLLVLICIAAITGVVGSANAELAAGENISPLTKNEFVQQYISTNQSRAALTFLLNQYRSKNYSEVANFSRLFIKSPKTTLREKAEAYQLLALAERRNNRPERELRAWMQFYNLTFNSDALLRVVKLHHLAGRYSAGLRIANRVKIEQLSNKGQTKWYKVTGDLYHDSRQLNNALYVRKRLTELQPNGQNYFRYSETLFALGKIDTAYAAIKRALSEKPDNPAFLLNKAYILSALGSTEEANKIVNELNHTALGSAKLKTITAQQKLSNGKRNLTKHELKQAIDSMNSGFRKPVLNQHIVDLSQLSIQSELRRLDNKFSFGISNSVCKDDNGCDGFLNTTSQKSSSNLGSLHALYQFNKKVSVSTNLMVQHDENSFGIDKDTAIASLGINFQPISALREKENNLRLSLEKQFAIGELADDNTKLTLSAKFTKGEKLKPSATNDKSWPYLHLYTEITKLFEHQKSEFAYLEGRYGRTIKLNSNTALSPYFFSQNQFYRDNLNKEKQSSEAGLGMALNIDQMIHPYKGARGHTELFVKAGRDLHVKEGDEEFRTKLGIEFKYQ